MSSEEAVESALAARRTKVNDALESDLPLSSPERLYAASRHLLLAGGKRLRPTIVLLAGEALADVEPIPADYRAFPDAEDGRVDLMAAAVSIEIIQSFTLIHDDILDDDEMRRGVPAVHEEYDLDMAILAGDTMFAKAFANLLESGAPSDRLVRALSELAGACMQICEGQALDVEFEDRGAVSPDEYLEMVELKTAVLYGAAASIPAVVLGHEYAVDALYGYGLDIGRAFQIQDDLLDLTTPTETIGKQRGSDLVEGKQTLITVHARDNGVDVDDLVPADTVAGVTDEQVDAAVAELEAAGSIEYARETARELIESGKRNLEVLPENESRALLEGIADYLIEREY